MVTINDGKITIEIYVGKTDSEAVGRLCLYQKAILSYLQCRGETAEEGISTINEWHTFNLVELLKEMQLNSNDVVRGFAAEKPRDTGLITHVGGHPIKCSYQKPKFQKP